MRPTISTVDLRAHPRYLADPGIGAFFGEKQVVLVNISVAGALIRHVDAIAHETDQALRLECIPPVAELHGEIIWTRTLSSSFESGVQFIQWIEVAQAVIDRLIERRAIRLDTSRPPSRFSVEAL